jgi:hypothetical protein
LTDFAASPVFVAVWGCILLICADFVAGVMVAFRRGEPDLRLLPRFLASEVLPYVGGLLILAFVAYLDDTGVIAGVLAAAVAAYGVKLLTDLKDKLYAWRGAKEAAALDAAVFAALKQDTPDPQTVPPRIHRHQDR